MGQDEWRGGAERVQSYNVRFGQFKAVAVTTLRDSTRQIGRPRSFRGFLGFRFHSFASPLPVLGRLTRTWCCRRFWRFFCASISGHRPRYRSCRKHITSFRRIRRDGRHVRGPLERSPRSRTWLLRERIDTANPAFNASPTLDWRSRSAATLFAGGAGVLRLVSEMSIVPKKTSQKGGSRGVPDVLQTMSKTASCVALEAVCTHT